MAIGYSQQSNFGAGVLMGGAASLTETNQYIRGLAYGKNISITQTGSIRLRSELRALTNYRLNDTTTKPLKIFIFEDSQGIPYFLQFVSNSATWHISRWDTGNSQDGITFTDSDGGDRAYDSHDVSHVNHFLDTLIICVSDATYYLKLGESPMVARQIVFKQKIRNTSNVTDVDEAPWGQAIPHASLFYQDRMIFAVDNTLYFTSLSEYLTGDDGDEVIFRQAKSIDNPEASDSGDVLATDAFKRILTAGNSFSVFDIRENNGLYVFTTEGIYYAPQGEVAPATFQLAEVIEAPIKPIPPALIGNQFVYIRDSNDGRESLWDLQQQFRGSEYAFTSQNLSLLIEDSLQNIIALTSTHGNEVDGMNMIYLLPEDSDELWVLHLNRTDNQIAWTKYDKVAATTLFSYDSKLYLGLVRETMPFEPPLDEPPVPYRVILSVLDNEDNSEVEWEFATLSPSITLRGSDVPFNVFKWSAIKAYIQTRNASKSFFVGGKEVNPYLLKDPNDQNQTGVYRVLRPVPWRNQARLTELTPEGIRVNGKGGGKMQIDRIDLDIEYHK